jgi:FkbM family methyltransferase
MDQGVRGSYRLYRLLARAAVFDSFTYRVRGTPFCVPVSNPDNAWAVDDVERYEILVLDSFCSAVERFPNITFIDCGADIGTFSALLLARLPRIREVIAIEPRPEVLPWLRRNLDALQTETRVVAGAVADFVGRGFIRHSPTDPSGHACFLAPDPAGNIDVVTIDSLGITSPCVALKIDVEGAEFQVLKGAYGLLRRAQHFAVVVEANRDAVARSGIDPIEFLRFLNSIRKCEFRIAETGANIDLGRPFLAQHPLRVSNIVAWTT